MAGMLLMRIQLVIRRRSVMNIDTFRCIMSATEEIRSSILVLLFNFRVENRQVFNLCYIAP